MAMDIEKMKEVVSRMKANRPVFPKRAVVTAGMPYGNKNLHYGHVCGMMVYADFISRFLRDKLGKENVIFVSGTDCYGSPIMEGYRKLKETILKQLKNMKLVLIGLRVLHLVNQRKCIKR